MKGVLVRRRPTSWSTASAATPCLALCRRRRRGAAPAERVRRAHGLRDGRARRRGDHRHQDPSWHARPSPRRLRIGRRDRSAIDPRLSARFFVTSPPSSTRMASRRSRRRHRSRCRHHPANLRGGLPARVPDERRGGGGPSARSTGTLGLFHNAFYNPERRARDGAGGAHRHRAQRRPASEAIGLAYARARRRKLTHRVGGIPPPTRRRARTDCGGASFVPPTIERTCSRPRSRSISTQLARGGRVVTYSGSPQHAARPAFPAQ